MSGYWDFESTDSFTTGAVGTPGARTFFLQVRVEDRYLTVKCEKEQVAALSTYLRKLLEDAPAVTERPLPGTLELREPAEPEFVLGSIGLGYDQKADRLILQLEEMPPRESADEDTGKIRLRITRGQAAAFCEHADDVVAAGRPSCVFCGLPRNPDRHACPRMN
jgi:uncharacterized repeat protein (TIGR03847 family)